jgi:ribosomal protein S25
MTQHTQSVDNEIEKHIYSQEVARSSNISLDILLSYYDLKLGITSKVTERNLPSHLRVHFLRHSFGVNPLFRQSS